MHLQDLAFLLICLLYARYGRDRAVWLVLAFSSACLITVNAAGFEDADTLWKPMALGAYECCTIGLIYRFAWNTTGQTIACLLVVAWLTHLQLLNDLVLGTNVVFTRYETIIFAISVLQLILGVNGIYLELRRLCASRLAPCIPSMVNCLSRAKTKK